LRFAVSNPLTAEIALKALCENCFFNNSDSIIAIPKQWQIEDSPYCDSLLYYDRALHIEQDIFKGVESDDWFIISNANTFTNIKNELPEEILSNLDADVILVEADNTLLSYHEKVCLTSSHTVAGFRRLYAGSVLPASFPSDWPDHVLVKFKNLNKIINDGMFPLNFADFIGQCREKSLNTHSLKVGGSSINLQTEAGLLSFLLNRIETGSYNSTSNTIADNVRLFGKVLLGKNVSIGSDAIITGPAIICDNVKVAEGAVVKSSVIGPRVSIPKGSLLQNCILTKQIDTKTSDKGDTFVKTKNLSLNLNDFDQNTNSDIFRRWSKFSYTGFLKRIGDIFAAILVIVLFVPFFPIIALAIKLSSPGPVFYKAKRQGLHGKDFDCLKFRSMILAADKMQDKLRVASQVDGPQFKIENDPRVSIVGHFLRETCIDEIPQFINVLIGQMSVVGPRPSPENENLLCPQWRYARLSVRPGITGLWQVKRTREPLKDFQEWVYYDTEYVRKVSLFFDLWICWKTALKLINKFVDQF